MPVHEQHPTPMHGMSSPRWYAWCPCGVCGPLRVVREGAVVDEVVHRGVCTRRTR